MKLRFSIRIMHDENLELWKGFILDKQLNIEYETEKNKSLELVIKQIQEFIRKVK